MFGFKWQAKVTFHKAVDIYFSIITPLYNSEHFITDAIESVMKQSFPNWEMIIVDDGSTDNSLAVAEQFANKDKRIKVAQHENGQNKGVSATRNLGIRHSSYQWLAMLDADDRWLPDKLEKDAAIITNNKCALVYSKAEVIDVQGAIINSKESKTEIKLNRTPVFGHGPALIDSFPMAVKEKWGVPTSTVVFFKDAATKYGFFNETTGDVEDFLLWYQLAEQGNVYFFNKVSAQYRIHISSWNAENSDYKKLIPRRQKMYHYLLQTVGEENKSIVSRKLVAEGFKLISRACLVVPHNDLKLVMTSLQKIIKDKNIRFRHKALSFFIFIQELVLVPIKLLRKFG